ncbi:hypothetical protein, partial [Accumulibacter sp.]|uniref:hypothetical protein n=1 Tax=Accumulibacter sp. TaxID=2053492 RepID=UPI002B77CEF0
SFVAPLSVHSGSLAAVGANASSPVQSILPTSRLLLCHAPPSTLFGFTLELENMQVLKSGKAFAIQVYRHAAG